MRGLRYIDAGSDRSLLIRGCAVLGMIATLLVGPSSSRAENSDNGPLTKVSVGTTGMTAAIWPLMIGVKKGIFQRHGIDVQLIQIQNASVNVQDLLGGELQFVSAGADAAIIPVVRGANLAVIAGIENLFVGRLVASKNISSLQDLKGKVLSVSRRNGPDTAAITEILAGAGIDVDPALFSVAGGSATRLAAVMNGGAAATLLVPPEDSRALAAGLKDLGLNVGRSKPLQFNVLFIDRKWGNANRPVLLKMLSGLIDSCIWLNDKENRDEASAILAEYTRINKDLAKQAYDVLVTNTRSFPKAGEISIDGFANVLKMLAGFGTIDHAFADPAKFVDESYLKQAVH